MQICLTEDERRKIDTAFPCDYAKSIREILPSWNGFYNVYDYRNKSFGEMTNIAELFTDYLFTNLLKD